MLQKGGTVLAMGSILKALSDLHGLFWSMKLSNDQTMKYVMIFFSQNAVLGLIPAEG